MSCKIWRQSLKSSYPGRRKNDYTSSSSAFFLKVLFVGSSHVFVLVSTRHWIQELQMLRSEVTTIKHKRCEAGDCLPSSAGTPIAR